jgi:broad specificity phosphatase PhoE
VEDIVIKLIRHGESEANIGNVNPQVSGDYDISLTEHGHEMAKKAGEELGADFINSALIYRSPYKRTDETLQSLIKGSGADIDHIHTCQDPRLREVDFGYGDVKSQQKHRRVHGWFYYRYEGGESPADCYDRTCSFLESMMRHIERKKQNKVLIVTHGLTIRCFVMRFLYLNIDQFDKMKNPENCDVITIRKKELLKTIQFSAGYWGVDGLRFYD